MDYERGKSLLLDALMERRGIQYLTDTAETVFENPVFIGDTSMNILYHSPGDTGDSFWETVCSLGYADDNIMKDCGKRGDFDGLYARDTPQLMRFSFSEKPFLSARIRDGSHMLAHACVYGLYRDFTEDDEKLIIIFCKVMAYEMLYRGMSANGNIAYYNLLADLLSGEDLAEKDIENRAHNAHCTFPATMRVAVVRHGDNGKNSLFLQRENLLRLLHHSLAVVYRDEIVIVLDATETCDMQNKEILEKVCGDTGATGGLSRPFTAPLEIGRAYRQLCAFLTALPDTASGKIYPYETLFPYHLFSLIQDEAALQGLTDPRLEKLRAWDCENHTELYESLRTYLASGRSVHAAATKLCIHKNSMYYRKQSIEELLKADLSDEAVCFALELAYLLEDYLRKEGR